MPQAQSNTTRQLEASLALFRPTATTPEETAKRLTAIREGEINRMERILEGESEHLPNSVTWRDAFCHECDKCECLQGTARQLAVKIYDLGWVAPSVRHPHLNCYECQEAS